MKRTDNPGNNIAQCIKWRIREGKIIYQKGIKEEEMTSIYTNEQLQA